MIPQILHQTWKTRALPERVQPYHASWPRLNPGLDVRFYDDADCRHFVATEFPHYLPVYEGFRFAIQRADFFRYLVVYRFGGLYADVDMECTRPMARFFATNGALFSIEARLSAERQAELQYLHPYQVANCIFAAEPLHPFLGLVIDEVVALAAARPDPVITDVENITGPRMLTRVFYRFAVPGVQVLKQIYWMAPYEYPVWLPLSWKSFARHHFWGSWKDARDPTPLRRRWIERFILPNPYPNGLYQSFDDAAAARTDCSGLPQVRVPEGG